MAPLVQLTQAMDPRAGLHGVWLMVVAPLVAAAVITRRYVYKIIFQERLTGDMALFQARLTGDRVVSCVAVPVQKLVHNFYGSGAAAPSIK